MLPAILGFVVKDLVAHLLLWPISQPPSNLSNNAKGPAEEHCIQMSVGTKGITNKQANWSRFIPIQIPYPTFISILEGSRDY